MNKPVFQGACTALVTPFLENRINYPLLEQLIKRQIAAGIRAVIICGTTGEAPVLSDEEKLELIRRAKDYAGGKCLVIAGTGSNSTSRTVALSKAAQDAGADALLVVSPYYNKATPEGLYLHYLSVAQAVQIPVILYNVPSRTGTDIPIEVYRRLSRISNIVGVKEASSDITKISRILSACGPDFSIWSGNDAQALPAIALGAQGIISVASNVAPGEVQAMASAVLDGDLDTALALHMQLLPLMEILFCESNPIPVKAAMECIGFDCGPCRLPLTRLCPENKEKIQRFFR